MVPTSIGPQTVLCSAVVVWRSACSSTKDFTTGASSAGGRLDMAWCRGSTKTSSEYDQTLFWASSRMRDAARSNASSKVSRAATSSQYYRHDSSPEDRPEGRPHATVPGISRSLTVVRPRRERHPAEFPTKSSARGWAQGSASGTGEIVRNEESGARSRSDCECRRPVREPERRPCLCVLLV
jgi:hypothetical protein